CQSGSEKELTRKDDEHAETRVRECSGMTPERDACGWRSKVREKREVRVRWLGEALTGRDGGAAVGAGVGAFVGEEAANGVDEDGEAGFGHFAGCFDGAVGGAGAGSSLSLAGHGLLLSGGGGGGPGEAGECDGEAGCAPEGEDAEVGPDDAGAVGGGVEGAVETV